MQHAHSHHCSACLGFSLIELLMALAISVTALLGSAQLQQKNLVVERELVRSLHAHLLLNEISAVLRHSPHPEYYLSSGNSTLGASNCLQKLCNPKEFAHFQLALWHCRVVRDASLCQKFATTKPPFAHASLSIGQSGQHFLIRLEWQTLSGQKKIISRKATTI
ncbi:MAG: prepilin-type N-terminal cleavage/methylation domain-containing protein [Chromatiales bacterium]|nr:prepilin-type N-terminal cleavage/methylation domain-containing protein [Chromatiales bacterium]